MKEHIEELREWLQGRRPGWNIRPAVRALMNEAADALESRAAPVGEPDCDRSACGDFSPGPCDNPDCPALRSNKAAPVAYITGQFAGRCVIEAINRAAVLPTGMPLYATPQPSAAPHGWKLVPVEPTDEMLEIGAQCVYEPTGKGDIDDVWSNMLAAAPSAPKADDPVKVQLLEALEAIVNEGGSFRFTHELHAKARAAIAAARQEGGKV